jgi:hypothetical protein
MGLARWLSWGQAFLPLALSIVVVVFGILARPEAIEQFVNSDSLLPAHMAWDVTRHDYALANFQWPRVPSLPDLAFFFALDLAGASWRTSMLLYICTVVAAVVAGTGWIVARMRGFTFRRGVFWAGIAVLMALGCALVGLGAATSEAKIVPPQLYLLVSVTHGNAFLLSLAASCTALGAIRGSRPQAWVTWAVCALGMFSDTIFLGYFIAPFVLAGLVLGLRHRGVAAAPSLQALLRFTASAVLACLIGWLAKLPLPIQEMVVTFPGPVKSLGIFLDDLPRMPWVILVLVLTALLGAWALWALRPSAGQSPATSTEIDRQWLALTGIGSSVMSLGLAVLLYNDSYAYRYALPFLWWPLAVALGQLKLPEGGNVEAAAGIVAIMVTACLPLGASLLPTWRAPLERCLSDHRAEWGLRAGLAPYWQSRQAMASSDWTLQLDPIDLQGNADMWGNNSAAFTHDMTAPERAPHYNFVVATEDLDPIRIETYFGPASRYETCHGFDILIFSNPIQPHGIDERPANSLGFKFIPMEH